MKNLYLFVFIFLQCYFVSNTYAQTGEIQGTVTDAETGETLPFVNVSIEVNGIPIGTTSDFDGIYSLTSTPSGFHTVTFSYVGFELTQVENVEVKDNKTTFLNLELHPSKILGRPNLIKLDAKEVQKALGRIIGKVTDAETGEALPFVNVAISIGGNLVGTSTDFDGIYELNSIRVGKYCFTFSYVGYRPLKINNIEIRKHYCTNLDVELEVYKETTIMCPPLIGYDPPLFSNDTRSGIIIKRNRKGHFDYSNIQ